MGFHTHQEVTADGLDSAVQLRNFSESFTLFLKVLEVEFFFELHRWGLTLAGVVQLCNPNGNDLDLIADHDSSCLVGPPMGLYSFRALSH